MDAMIEGLGFILKEYGFFAAAVVYFMYRDARREDTMRKENQSLQKEFRDVMLPVVKNSIKTSAEATAAIEHNSNMIDDCKDVLCQVKMVLNRVAA